MAGRLRHRRREQAAPDDDHGETTGVVEAGVQREPEAGATRPGTAELGDGARHARRTSVVPEPTRQGEAAEEGRRETALESLLPADEAPETRRLGQSAVGGRALGQHDGWLPQ